MRARAPLQCFAGGTLVPPEFIVAQPSNSSSQLSLLCLNRAGKKPLRREGKEERRKDTRPRHAFSSYGSLSTSAFIVDVGHRMAFSQCTGSFKSWLSGFM